MVEDDDLLLYEGVPLYTVIVYEVFLAAHLIDWKVEGAPTRANASFMLQPLLMETTNPIRCIT